MTHFSYLLYSWYSFKALSTKHQHNIQLNVTPLRVHNDPITNLKASYLAYPNKHDLPLSNNMMLIMHNFSHSTAFSGLDLSLCFLIGQEVVQHIFQLSHWSPRSQLIIIFATFQTYFTINVSTGITMAYQCFTIVTNYGKIYMIMCLFMLISFSCI